jgi:hypothetical protein
MPLSPADVGKRVVVFVLAVGVVIGGAAAGGAVLSPPPVGQDTTVPDYPEYDAEKLAPTQLEDTGAVDALPVADSGAVVVDLSHQSRVTRSAFTPLQDAVVQAGGEFGYLEGPVDAETLNQTLASADAFVVADIGAAYDDDELAALDAFVDSGGHLLVLGEPNYKEIVQTGPTSSGLVTRQSHLAEVASLVGLSFGTEYLVNLEANNSDGIYKNVEAASTGDSRFVNDVENAVFYTATTVRSARGTTLLSGTEGTRKASTGDAGSVPVAAVNEEETAIGVGDTTFLEEPNHNVADNEAFISRLGEFLASGDADYDPEATTTTS